MNNPRELIPVSLLNTYVYCSRRFYLEHNLGMFEDNDHTVEGRTLHRFVDSNKNEAEALKKDDVIHRKSVMFSSDGLGIIGKLDLLEEKENCLYPVEYKKAKKLKNREPWLNDRIQLCAQALLMQDNGLKIPDRAYLYYIGSKARVEVLISDELIQETLRVIAECRLVSSSDSIPNIVENRNKCFGCSLNAVCLPEEEEVIKGRKINAKTILPMVVEGDILYVDKIGSYIGLSGLNLKITEPGGNEIGNASLETLREIVICGPAQITTQAIHECLKNNIPIHYLSYKGQYLGTTSGMLHYHGLLREAQWRTHFDPAQCMEFAKVIVKSKIINMRTIMMRYIREERTETDENSLEQIKSINKNLDEPFTDMNKLRGYEGMASRWYFGFFDRFIKPDKRSFFFFNDRNRRPPKDPINALLSFGYSLLAKDCTGIAIRVGFDPYCGFYHVMKYGRPSMALDVMEFFRQPIVDSVVLSSINNGIFNDTDFNQYQGVCYLNEKGRKKFFVQYEVRKKDMVTHPKFHYRLSYERTIELQYRLIGKYLLKDIDNYEGFYIR